MVNNFFQLINIVLVLGFPATGAIVFGVTRDPIKAAIGMGIYAIIAVAVAIGQRMNERFVEDAGDYFYDTASAPFRSHHKRYVKYLEDRYTFLDLKGTGDRGTFDPELKDVFVNLRVVEIDDTGDLRRSLILDRETTGDVHDIWHFVKKSDYKHLAILGPPGSGKTTIMQHILMTLTIPRLRRKVRVPRKMPVFLFLREHASAIKENPDITIIELVNMRLESMVSKLHPDWIQRQLLKGNCLVLLDGLDEVSEDETRNAVSKWVKSQIENYPDNYFYISSRPGGYNHDIFRGSGIHVIDVQTFNREQQESFIYKWYLVNESRQKDLPTKDSKVVLAAKEGKLHFFRQVQRVSALADMASNPLLLTLMAILHSRVGSIPQKRSELYKQIFDVLLQKRQQAKGLPDDSLSNEQKLQVLKPLAFYIMKRANGVDISVNEAKQEVGKILERVDASVEMSDFLKTIYHGSGLMNPHQIEGLYRFSHKTFMEYLTALYIKENLQKQEVLETLTNKISDEWWHETIRLYCTMSDATPVIKACIDAINPDAENLDFAPLVLGIECLAERASIEPVIEFAFHKTVADGMGSEDEKRARYFREGRLSLRLNNMVETTGKIEIASDTVTNAEYALFLEENPQYYDFCLPKTWYNDKFPVGQGNSPVKGIYREAGQLFSMWLSIKDRKRAYRLPSKNDKQYIDTSFRDLVLVQDNSGGIEHPRKILKLVTSSLLNTVLQTANSSNIMTQINSYKLDRENFESRVKALSSSLQVLDYFANTPILFEDFDQTSNKIEKELSDFLIKTIDRKYIINIDFKINRDYVNLFNNTVDTKRILNFLKNSIRFPSELARDFAKILAKDFEYAHSHAQSTTRYNHLVDYLETACDASFKLAESIELYCKNVSLDKQFIPEVSTITDISEIINNIALQLVSLSAQDSTHVYTNPSDISFCKKFVSQRVVIQTEVYARVLTRTINKYKRFLNILVWCSQYFWISYASSQVLLQILTKNTSSNFSRRQLNKEAIYAFYLIVNLSKELEEYTPKDVNETLSAMNTLDTLYKSTRDNIEELNQEDLNKGLLIIREFLI